MTARQPQLLLLRAIERIGRRERAAAWVDVRRASAAAPGSALVRLCAARLLRVLGDGRGALEEAKAAAALGAVSARMDWFHRARELGCHREARDVLEAILSAAGAQTSDATIDVRPNSLVDQALHHLVQLYVDARYDDLAATACKRHWPLVERSASLLLLAARACVRLGEVDQALAATRRILPTALPVTKLEVGSLLLELGAFEDARRLYEALAEDDAVAVPALQVLARLRLWTGDAAGALAYAERIRTLAPNSPAWRRTDAAAKVLRGDFADALSVLDAVLREDPSDGEAYLWRAEASLRLGRRDQAKADADRSMYYGNSFAASAIHLLGELVPGPVPRTKWEDLAPELVEMCDDARAVLERHRLGEESWTLADDGRGAVETLPSDVHADGLISLLERALSAMRGNRTPLATWVRSDGQLARAKHPTSPRDGSRDAMQLITIASPEEAFRQLDELAARFPESSMPWVYRGELQLWLGRWGDARADLERAISIHRQTRWAWYGLACLELITGDPERALDTCARGIEVMDNTEGPVALLCRGEAYRLLGRLDEARDQLERSCRLNPTRLSSWVNLALVHGAAGDRSAQRAIFHRLIGEAPTLIAEAARDLDDDAFRALVLEGPIAGPAARAEPAADLVDRVLFHVLVMMRGNRSSSCITYFTADGLMHHVPQHSAPLRAESDHERKVLREVQALVRRWMEGRN